MIAGPVATRTLALLRADVLRIDSPLLPESHIAHADTGFGKWSACLDLADDKDRAVFEKLLAGKKILVLLDDAVGHEQVKPLLPGTAGRNRQVPAV